MTRLERELNGELGQFWKTDAEKRVAKVAKEFKEGKITIDENHVLRNCIGRVVTREIQELFFMGLPFDFDFEEIELIIEGTEKAREEATIETIESYKRACQREYTSEEMFEMESAFGKGTTVVNVLTGKKVRL